MTHAHARASNRADGAKRNEAWQPGGHAWRACLVSWLAFLACLGVRPFTTRNIVLDSATVTSGAAAVLLSWWVLTRLYQRIERHTSHIKGMREGLEHAVHYAYRPGDGAAACPMGGGKDCPQVNGGYNAADTTSWNVADLMRDLDNGPAGRSYPGGR